MRRYVPNIIKAYTYLTYNKKFTHSTPEKAYYADGYVGGKVCPD